MSKICVLGGNGFIGTNFIDRMLCRESVTNIDCEEKEDDPFKGRQGYGYIKAGIGEVDAVDLRVNESDYVVNFAAHTHVDVSIKDPVSFAENNILDTMNVLESCKKFNKPLFHISTDEVYGELMYGDAHEKDPILPNNPYSVTKASIDLMIRAYRRTYGCKMTCIRLCNNFGPYQSADKFIPVVITRALLGQDVPIYGNGLQVRQWLYVKETCRAIEFIIRHVMETNGHGVFNVPCTMECSNIALAEKILGYLSADKSLLKFVEDRKGHDIRYGLSGGKIKSIGWSSNRDFNADLFDTVQWYKENQDWWKGKV
jgi:dTDP-glucose 4,6-dehydratase